jgi:hypothetical protein
LAFRIVHRRALLAATEAASIIEPKREDRRLPSALRLARRRRRTVSQ